MRIALLLPLLLTPALPVAAGPATAPSASAEPPQPWFEVELLVFRNTVSGAAGRELWPADPGRPAVDGAPEPAEAGTPDAPFVALPPASSRLTKEWDSLRRSSRYQPVAYFAWVQPPFERGAAPAVRLASPAPPPAPLPPIDAAAVLAGTAPPAPPPPDPTLLPALRTPLDGIATLGLQRYLYLSLDLVFRPDDAALASDGQPFGGWRLAETRRMRSKELHYFDNPTFGVLALITPRPAPEQPPGATGATP
jgi:hypothetical protein